MQKHNEIYQVDFTKYYQLPELHVLPNRIAVLECLDELRLKDKPFMNHTAVFVFCKAGQSEFTLDNRSYKLSAGMVAIIAPGQVVAIKQSSDDVRYTCIALTREFICETEARRVSFDELFAKMRHNAVLQLSLNDYTSLLDTCELLKNKFAKCSNNNNHKALIDFLAISIFCECRGYLSHKSETRKLLSPKEQLFKEFIRLVAENYKRERTIAYYAKQLKVTPQCLSAAIEATSSRSAKEWIDDYVLQRSKELLANSFYTIQQIAEYLHFPDQSIFGKYFKRLVGISPLEYRKPRKGNPLSPSDYNQTSPAV